MSRVSLTMRVDAQDVVARPEHILQEFSIMLMRRRRDVLTQMLDREVYYKGARDTPHHGTLVAVQADHCIVNDGARDHRVAFERMLI